MNTRISAGLAVLLAFCLCLGTNCTKSEVPAAGTSETVTEKVTGAPADTPAAGTAASEAAAAATVSEEAGTPDVWCCAEYYRIDPVTGEVAELGYKPVTDSFRKLNEVYNAETNTVNLAGMQGETLAFQVMIEGAHTDLSIAAEGLPGKVDFIYEGYLHWFDKEAGTVRYAADVAVPMEWIGSSFGIADVPEQLPQIEGKRMQAVWVDIAVPRSLVPGTVTGAVTVKAGEAELSVIPVVITVIDQAIPEQPTYLNAMIQYGMCSRGEAREREAYRQMHAHRLTINDVPYSSQRGWGYEGIVPVTTLSPAFAKYDDFRKQVQKMTAADRDAYEYLPQIAALKDPKNHTVSGDDLKQRFEELMPLQDMILRECIRVYNEKGAGITDWSAFDQRYGPFFDGSAFDDGIPVPTFELPFNFNWPAPLDGFGIMDPQQSAMYEDIWGRVAQDFLKHANDKGWTRTRFFVYFNPKDRGNNLVMWKGDEPCEKHDFLGHKYWNGLFWKAFADPGQVQVDHKIEVGHWECDAGVCRKRQMDSKTWDEDNAREMLKSFRVWVPNSRHYHSALPLAWKGMDEEGDIYFNYGGLADYTQTSMGVYGLAFLGFQDRSAGYFCYIPTTGDLGVWRDNPGLKIKDSKAAQGNNDIACYDAAAFGRPESFLMSLHLKALRSVEQHYAAFRMAAAKDKGFGEDLKAQTVKYIVAAGGEDRGSTIAVTNNNPRDLNTARLKALALIAGRPELAAGLAYEGSIKGVEARSDTFHYCISCGEACSPVKCEWCGALQAKAEEPPAAVPAGPVTTVVLQQGTDGYAACRDHYVNSETPDLNRDDRLVLESDTKNKQNAILIRFEIPADKVVPAAQVVSAELVLHCSRQSIGGGKGQICMLKDAWTIPMAYDAAAALAGAVVADIELANYRTGGETNIDPPVPVTFDVTRAVRNWVPDRHVNHGVIILPVKTDECDVRFIPSEDKRSEFRPRLVIRIRQ